MTGDWLPFSREAPCPACGIALETRKVCREAHAGPVGDMGAGPPPAEHLHVACPGCGWTGLMATAGAARHPRLPP